MPTPTDFWADKRTQEERDQDNDIIRLMQALADITPEHTKRLAGGDHSVLVARLEHVLSIVR
jgi:hypothetical protein